MPQPDPVEIDDEPVSDSGPSFQIPAPKLPQTTLTTDIDLGQIDGERMPIVRVAPQFPRRCAERGISGWVVLEFTVNDLGMVEEPSVIDSDPSGCFNRAALKTISRFKYKPTIIDGQPRASAGVRFRMSFNIDE